MSDHDDLPYFWLSAEFFTLVLQMFKLITLEKALNADKDPDDEFIQDKNYRAETTRLLSMSFLSMLIRMSLLGKLQ
ncbi:unnamed protein product [Clonostachys rosea f. rosea IK726]|jgi:hypothetical protein|uniref:Uncharacterized protein n=1 Tax=Clonostachys rosea f. rosea IK726 TaxID=1349383 RepID=A0ACA9U5P0_BIOOC|nr:unnamed protein product [Clonostachys rosea f. rosea IK726]